MFRRMLNIYLLIEMSCETFDSKLNPLCPPSLILEKGDGG